MALAALREGTAVPPLSIVTKDANQDSEHVHLLVPMQSKSSAQAVTAACKDLATSLVWVLLWALAVAVEDTVERIRHTVVRDARLGLGIVTRSTLVSKLLVAADLVV